MKPPTKRHVMWRIIRMRRVFDVSDLQELAGVSQAYVYQFLDLLLQNEIVKKLPGGKYQLRKDTIELPFEVILHFSKKDLPLVKTDRPEDIIWEKIIALSKDGKEFLYEDIISPALPKRFRHYMAALVKAGYISKQYKKRKKKDGSGDSRARYRLVKNTGKHAPIIGRTFYLWDRNIDTVWTQPPDLDKYLEKKK